MNIFYREAGPKDGPVVVLLHGFPTSSHMFRNLMPLLADRYRVIAPDYPGLGQSDAPDHTKFAYTFGHYADLVDGGWAIQPVKLNDPAQRNKLGHDHVSERQQGTGTAPESAPEPHHLQPHVRMTHA